MPREKTWVKVDGERLCAEMVAERCRVPLPTARSRVIKYSRGEIGRETLLHEGPKRANGKTIRKLTVPTEEWRRMNRRQASDPEFEAGSWERRHLAGLGEGRAPGRNLVDARTVGHTCYSGQYRITI